MLTGAQIRAARAALGWSTVVLAEKAGVASKTISRFEEVNGVPPSRSSTLLEVKAALEDGGIEFTGSPGSDPGIVIKSKSPP